MDADDTPIYGRIQPALGRKEELVSNDVSKPKSSKVVSWAARQARMALGRNLRAQMARVYPDRSETYASRRGVERLFLKLR
jgi:hypothetical protein